MKTGMWVQPFPAQPNWVDVVQQRSNRQNSCAQAIRIEDSHPVLPSQAIRDNRIGNHAKL